MSCSGQEFSDPPPPPADRPSPASPTTGPAQGGKDKAADRASSQWLTTAPEPGPQHLSFHFMPRVGCKLALSSLQGPTRHTFLAVLPACWLM